METREQQLVMILADISGYTKFMVENQLAAVHGQLCITFLIETILREVNIPLHLQGIEETRSFCTRPTPETTRPGVKCSRRYGRNWPVFSKCSSRP